MSFSSVCKRAAPWRHNEDERRGPKRCGSGSKARNQPPNHLSEPIKAAAVVRLLLLLLLAAASATAAATRSRQERAPPLRRSRCTPRCPNLQSGPARHGAGRDGRRPGAERAREASDSSYRMPSAASRTAERACAVGGARRGRTNAP